MMASNTTQGPSPSHLPMVAGILAILLSVMHIIQGMRELIAVMAFDEPRFVVSTLIFNSFGWTMSILGILAGVWLMQGKSSGWLIIASMRVSFAIAWIYIFLTVGNPMAGANFGILELLTFLFPWIAGIVLLVLIFLPGTMGMVDKKGVWVLISIALGTIIYAFTQLIQGMAMTFN